MIDADAVADAHDPSKVSKGTLGDWWAKAGKSTAKD